MQYLLYFCFVDNFTPDRLVALIFGYLNRCILYDILMVHDQVKLSVTYYIGKGI